MQKINDEDAAITTELPRSPCYFEMTLTELPRSPCYFEMTLRDDSDLFRKSTKKAKKPIIFGYGHKKYMGPGLYMKTTDLNNNENKVEMLGKGFSR